MPAYEDSDSVPSARRGDINLVNNGRCTKIEQQYTITKAI